MPSLVLVVLLRLALATTVPGAIVCKFDFPYNFLTMLPSYCVKVIARSTRWLGLGSLLAALSLPVMADSVTVNFDIDVASTIGTGSFTYDSSATASDGFGSYADYGNGLDSFTLAYGGTTYNLGDALDYPTLPTVFLPGNTYPSGTPSPNYGLLALWVVSGTCDATGTPGEFDCDDATLLGLSRNSVQTFLANGVTDVTILGSGSTLKYNIGTLPTLEVTSGTLTFVPEPTLFSLMALGFAGLLFVRRRQKVL